MNKLQKYKLPVLYATFLLAVAVLSLTFAIERVAVCDYISINGDFQSFNIFRRILDGQSLYTDFANYIGMAPIFINMPFLLFNGSFANSLFVTTFSTSFLFCIAVFVLSNLITKNKVFSCFIAVFIPKLVSTQILYYFFGPKYGYLLTQRFEGLYTPSNSMRGARSFLPILLVIFVTLFCYFYNKKTKAEFVLIDKMSEYKTIAVIGLILGFFIVWSNDFGLACVAAVFIILISLQIFKYKLRALDFIKLILLYFSSGAIGLLASTTIITGGRPDKWFIATAKTAEFQFFYFNGTQGKAILTYLASEGILWAYTSVLLGFLAYYLWRLIKNKATDTTLMLVFIALSMLGATFIYVCGGSGYKFREALEVYAILFAGFYLAKGLLWLVKKRAKVVNVCLYCALSLLTAYLAFTLLTSHVPQKGKYYPQLGGTSTFDRALQGASEYIGDQKIFSLYATGLEVITDQFQPTGYDYIIHALGSDTQQSYAKQFVDGDYKYVQTPNMGFGSWLANVNWYFYRHLVGSYEKVFQTEYSFIWEKADIPPIMAEVKIEIVKTSPTTTEIICTSDNTQSFLADVLIDYDTSFDGPINYILSLGRKTLSVNTTCCIDDNTYYGLMLPSKSQEYIPIMMNNGKGKAVLSGAYGNGVELDLKSAKFIGALPTFKLY